MIRMICNNDSSSRKFTICIFADITAVVDKSDKKIKNQKTYLLLTDDKTHKTQKKTA